MRRLIAIAILAGAAALVPGCNRSNPAPTEKAAAAPAAGRPSGRVTLPAGSPKLARIRAAPVEMRPAPVDEIVAPGKVEANPNRISRITMPVPGRVLRVLVRLGDAVGQGQPLLVVDSAEAGAAIAAYRQAQSQARVAASALQKAQADLARLKELHENRAAALKDVLAAQNDAAQAQAAVELAHNAREEARHRLELLGIDPSSPAPEVTVRAPLSGKVLDLAVVPGEYRTDTNAPLMTIADLGTVWITADVPESMIRLVHLGEGLEVNLAAFPGETFRGRVARIADLVDPQSRSVKVQAEIPNPAGRLRPEMFGQIRHVHSVRLFPAVPAGALLQLEGRNVVWLEEGPGAFRAVPVQTGPARNGMVAILSGLKPGDRIVVDGVTLLRDE